MPKSKRSLKRRNKVKKRILHQKYSKPEMFDDELGKEYMKTNGKGEVMIMSGNHDFIRFATEEESNEF